MDPLAAAKTTAYRHGRRGPFLARDKERADKEGDGGGGSLPQGQGQQARLNNLLTRLNSSDTDMGFFTYSSAGQ